MKKMLRLAVAFAALAAMTSFIACSNDDDDGDDNNKNGLENTYWTAEDISEDATETVNITLKNAVYIHIEDSSKGSAYGADVESIDYTSLDYTTTNSVNINYSSEKDTFTYVVDGSKITITSKYTDDDGKEQTETIEGTLASDKKSFTTTETDDGETVTTTYTRISNAPANATLVITVAGSDSGETGGESGGSTSGSEESTTVDAAWDFNVTALTNAGLTTTAAKPSADAEIAVSSGSGAKLTLLAQTGKSLKIQNATSGGLNIGAGSAETEVLSITVDEACTLKFKGKGSSGSSFATTKPNSFSIAGNQIYTRATADETTEQEWTYTISEAGTYKIAASGMIFTALTCE